MKKKIIVIGAGASGLMAAVSAARAGADVTILEAQERPGRKLLVTGNGRCNLTSAAGNFSGKYHGTGVSLAEELLTRFSADDTLNFFTELGLLTQKKGEYVYPYTSLASSVLEVLLAELRRLRVKLKFSMKISEIVDLGNQTLPQSSPRYSVVTSAWTYTADAVILACGSKAAPSTGSSGDGYTLAENLGHSVINPRPALVPFICGSPFSEQGLAGVRCRAAVTLMRRLRKRSGEPAYEPAAQETGELQWTKYGVSGIVIFQLSRFVHFPSTSGHKAAKDTKSHHCGPEESRYALSIDFLPDYSKQEIEALLFQRAALLPDEPVSVLLRGLLNEKLIPAVLKRTEESGSGRPPMYCSEFADNKDFLPQLVKVMKGYLLPVTGTKSYDQAQVCAGGVDCTEISEKLESRLHRGLYFAGELLDVDGPCGGYNLQWAWTSGYLSGKYAALDKRHVMDQHRPSGIANPVP